MNALPHTPGRLAREVACDGHRAQWIPDGTTAYAEMGQQIDAARQSVRLEWYMVRPAGPAERLCAALLRALHRQVDVRVLVDAYGSAELPAGYFSELERHGARVRVFNPRRLLRLTFRNHRKLLVCDGKTAVVGGFNIGPEYDGDGVAHGWRDLGVLVNGRVVSDLGRSFDRMFELAEFTPGALRRHRASERRRNAGSDRVALLTSGPGSGRSALQYSLKRDLSQAHSVMIMAAYFLPSAGIRRLLRRCVQRGGRVQVILAGRTDVPLAKLAAEHHYARLMNAGVDIYEYQPQILHAKALFIDDVAYVGSCNLDARSLRINYELLLRLDCPEFTALGRKLFLDDLDHCRRVVPKHWTQSRSRWRALRSRVAHFLLARIDPLIAQRKLRALA